MKLCRSCNKHKKLSDFYSHKNCAQGVRPDCKLCMGPRDRSRSRRYVKNNPEKRQSTVLMAKYGISLAEYNQRLEEQNNCCKICGSTNPGPKGTFAVDHCHKTGRVRALLCYLCNIGLGSFRDNTEILDRAIKYLRWHNG